MGPVLGIGQVVHKLVQHISTGGRQVYPFRCDHVIQKIVQHISTEGGSEQEGNLSFKVFLYKGLQYMYAILHGYFWHAHYCSAIMIHCGRPWYGTDYSLTLHRRIDNRATTLALSKQMLRGIEISQHVCYAWKVYWQSPTAQ